LIRVLIERWLLPGVEQELLVSLGEMRQEAVRAPGSTHYLTDTFNGQSGSGVYVFCNSGRYVAAAHRGTCSAVSSTSNCGVRITSSRYSQIQGWINSGF
jgi:V8-like Glu-specific endopeptidase